MADILTRLLLKTDNFDANLSRSKASVNSFQNDIAGMASRAGSSIAGFAGGIGIAMGAAEAFNKTIGSTQTTGDAFAKKMDQAKGSVDAFFASIAMGDFSGFLSNLGNVIGKSGELSALMDELATKSLFADAELNGLLTQKRLQENIAKDKTKSDAERNKALEKARSLQIEINKLQSGLAGTNKATAYATLDAGIAKQGLKGNVARETWDFALKESNRQKVTNYANMYRGKLSQIDNAKEMNMNTGMLMETPESKRLQANFNKWVKGSNGQFAKFAYYFSEMDDGIGSDIKKAILLIDKADSMKGAISDAELVLNNTDAKINGSHKSNNKNDSNTGGNETPLAGSLAYFDAEIAKKNKELINATDKQARAAIQATISELEKQRVEVLVSDKGDSLEALSIQIAELKGKFASATTDDARKEIDKLIKEIEAKQVKIKMTVKYDVEDKPVEKSGIPTSSAGISKEEIKNMKLPKFTPPISKKDVKLNEEYADSLTAMGTIMGTLSGAFDSNTASVLQWGSALFTTIAQAIPAIIGMMEVKATDTTVTQANTTAEVGNATAKMLSAHAGIPFAGIAIGLAGVASIIAAMSSTPKFATGGIVPGSSFAGDNVLARVNSGEMILNAGQQRNLFSILNGVTHAGISAEALTRGVYGGINMGVISPQVGNIARFKKEDRSDTGEPIGKFCITGRDLELALKNQLSRKSRVRGSNIYL